MFKICSLALEPNQPSLQFFNMYWVFFFPGIKWAGYEVDHTPSSAKGKKEWSYVSSALTCLHGMDRDLNIFVT